MKKVHMMRRALAKFAFCMPLIIHPLLAEEETMVIESGVADYDGKQITLSGDVVVEHELGHLSANHIVLIPESDTKKIRFAFLQLLDNVKVTLKDGGKLTCSCADLDYSNMTGKFTGNAQQEYVVYTEACEGKSDARIPVVVKSREMAVLLKRDPDLSAKSPRSLIHKITADKKVTVNYNHDFIVASDHAVYQRLAADDSSANLKMAGFITMSADNSSGYCQITNRNGDLIRATQIDIDTAKRNLHFASPKGAIFLTNKEDKQERIDFISDTMTWDDNRDLLTLKDHVSVSQNGIGQLKSNREVQLFHYKAGGKKRVRCIESVGETVLVHTDEEKKHVHTLTAHGKVTVDHEHLQTIIESPRNENNRVIPDKQVYFSDHLGEIYADRVVLDYEQENGALAPVKLTLEGNVHILNRSSVNPVESEAFLQYAIADKVEFYPKSSEMILSSLGSNRVIFLDKGNNLQVSAPGLKIKRDPTAKKESIQGIGDVRFSFVDQELEKLKKHFSLDSLKNH